MADVVIMSNVEMADMSMVEMAEVVVAMNDCRCRGSECGGDGRCSDCKYGGKGRCVGCEYDEDNRCCIVKMVDVVVVG